MWPLGLFKKKHFISGGCNIILGQFLQRAFILFIFLNCSFFYYLFSNILLQCVVHALRNPCNLYASIGLQPTVIEKVKQNIQRSVLAIVHNREQQRRYLCIRPKSCLTWKEEFGSDTTGKLSDIIGIIFINSVQVK